MFTRLAKLDDLPVWLEIADEVCYLFGAPNLARDSQFIAWAKQKITKQTAIVAVPTEGLSPIGVITVSLRQNQITWLAVRRTERGQGAGGMLVEAALAALDAAKPVSVITFRESMVQGRPARKLYRRFGFVEVDDTIFDHLQNERALFQRVPQIYR